MDEVSEYQRQPVPLWRRLLWFALLWVGSVLTLGLVAGVLRTWLRAG
ncbi:DUF2474 domain-containing protein [Methylobacterium goesingense]|uniref:DUF2474 domain-containing protein n=1 Tax=Methylobacterium goesingense TaxID=243690 RepID=A0ABV2LC66_9HYPH|nr:DUF2474 domain-containing protein [Methylobacterium goesingense]GJD74006.1 hypothetical protein CFIICLFH_2239 [Methylobacterium goesingense]